MNNQRQHRYPFGPRTPVNLIKPRKPKKMLAIAVFHFVIVGWSILMMLILWITAPIYQFSVYVLRIYSSEACCVICGINLVQYTLLLLTITMNSIAGVGILISGRPGFLKLSKVGAVFCIGNLLAFDFISPILAIIILKIRWSPKIEKYIVKYNRTMNSFMQNQNNEYYQNQR